MTAELFITKQLLERIQTSGSQFSDQQFTVKVDDTLKVLDLICMNASFVVIEPWDTPMKVKQWYD